MYRFLLLFVLTHSFEFDIYRRYIIKHLPLTSFERIPQIMDDDILINPEDKENDILITPENRSLYFYGDVTEKSCFWLTHTLEEFSRSLKPIHLHIQSPGGSLIPTFNVIDTINRLPSPVYTYIDGFAASAATLISVAGKKRYMGKHSLILLHELRSASEGTYSNMKDEISNLDIYMDFVKEIYMEHSNIQLDVLEDILSHDNRWMNSTTALKYGLVDKII